eukprot:1161056-Pelagomonas_calceolata.AAC.5
MDCKGWNHGNPTVVGALCLCVILPGARSLRNRNESVATARLTACVESVATVCRVGCHSATHCTHRQEAWLAFVSNVTCAPFNSALGVFWDGAVEVTYYKSVILCVHFLSQLWLVTAAALSASCVSVRFMCLRAHRSFPARKWKHTHMHLFPCMVGMGQLNLFPNAPAALAVILTACCTTCQIMQGM